MACQEHMKQRCRLAAVIMAVFSLLAGSTAYAQPKAVGMSFSFNDINISYEHSAPDGSFTEFAIGGRFAEMFLGRRGTPGIEASMTWNLVMSETVSSEDNAIVFFAGPGIAAGWGDDYKTPEGFYFGLKGRVGAECRFEERGVAISAFLSAVAGLHMIILEDSISMRYYRNGILYALIPQISVKYSF